MIKCPGQGLIDGEPFGLNLECTVLILQLLLVLQIDTALRDDVLPDQRIFSTLLYSTVPCATWQSTGGDDDDSIAARS